MSETEIIEEIILYLYRKPLEEKVSLSELLDALNLSSSEAVIDALSKLKSIACIKITVVGPTAMLCWLTYNGRKIAKDFIRKNEITNTTLDNKTSAPYNLNQPQTPKTAQRQKLQFSWSLEGLEPQQAYIVQRQNLVEQIQNIFEQPSDSQMVFLYGSGQVGKTFVLNRLKETLAEQYVPVLIHVNGWVSISKLPAFLYELAANIKSDLDFFQPSLQLDPFRSGSELEATIEFAKFMDQLVQLARTEGRELLLMFDDLEYLADTDTDLRIFEYLRGCIETYLARNVRFVFAGSGYMFELLKYKPLAMLLARSRPVRIFFFEPDISRTLVETHLKRYFRVEPKVLDKVIRLGNGHPGLLKSVLTLLVRHWRKKSKKEPISEADLDGILKKVCLDLGPKLTDIWSALPSQEKRILQHLAQHRKESFRIHDVVIRNEPNIERYLNQLVERQILAYLPQSQLYTVRIGLLIESLSRGIFSVKEENKS